MINLERNNFIGKGYHRLCYRHPEYPGKCIKVSIKKKIPRRQNEIESKYMNLLNRRLVPFTHIPKCYGWVETNLGPGLVFDLIESDNKVEGTILHKAIIQKIYPRKELEKKLQQVFQYLMDNSIVFADVSLKNMLCVIQDAELKIYIIDGLGSRHINLKFFLNMNILFLARRKTSKQIKKLWLEFNTMYTENNYI